jgi:hypothetical protein
MTTSVTVTFCERPILFSGPMVRAILEGRKTQTRRVVPATGQQAFEIGMTTENFRRSVVDRCRYGQPGVRLWVRETFYIDLVPFDRGPLPKERPKELPAWKCSKCGLETGDGADILGPIVNGVRYLVCPVCRATGEFVDANECIYYRADGECCEQIPECCCGEIGRVPWRPSIHMPRWASRLTLEITEVRVERLQEMTDTDGMREGWQCGADLDYLPRLWYRDLWDSLNAKRGHGWDKNPWVWVVSFRRADS